MSELLPEPEDGKTEPSPEAPEIDLRELLGERSLVIIRHEDERYVLRLTRQNKLLLTK